MLARSRAMAAGAALLLGGAALVIGAGPVGARSSVPNVRGSYYGSFRSAGGDFMPVAIHIVGQEGRRISGSVELEDSLGSVTVSGRVGAGGAFALSGRGNASDERFRLRMSGTLRRESRRRIELEGTYRMEGAVRQRGIVRAMGSPR